MLNILVVDDDPNTRLVIEQVFKRTFRFPVLTAENGKKALEIIESNDIDVLCTDISMPEMNGIDLIKGLGEKNKITTIVMTAENDKEIISQLLSLGVRNFIIKPFNLNDTQNRLKKIILPMLEKKREL